jgi:hypothetical protein
MVRGEPMFIVGVHSGERVSEVADIDPDYVAGLMSLDMCAEERAALESVLSRSSQRVFEMVLGDDGVYRMNTMVYDKREEATDISVMMSGLFRKLRGE